MWDSRLKPFFASRRLETTLGADGTGSIYNPDNMRALTTLFPDNADTDSSGPCDLLLGDGGFLIEGPSGRRHVEHLQESIVSKLVYSEVLAGLRLLKDGGNMVVKVFGSCTQLTFHILYLLLLCFRSLHIVKPGRSRLVNEEKYIVARGYNRLTPPILDHLEAVLREWNRRDDGASEPQALECLFTSDFRPAYGQLVSELCRLNNSLISASNNALASVIDHAEEIVSRRGTKGTVTLKRIIRV